MVSLFSSDDVRAILAEKLAQENQQYDHVVTMTTDSSHNPPSIPPNSVVEVDTGNSAMVIESEGEYDEGGLAVAVAVDEDEDEDPIPLSLLEAAMSYDGGKSFGGSFSRVPLGTGAKIEAHVKRHLHLLSQLVVLPGQYGLLRVYFDINYIVSCIIARNDGSSINSEAATTTTTTTVVVSTGSDASITQSSVSSSSVVTPTTTIDESSLLSILQRLIRTDFPSLVPAMVSHKDPVAIFNSVKKPDCLTTNFNLLELTIGLLLFNYQMPASMLMVNALKQYVKDNAVTLANTTSDSDDMLGLFPDVQDAIQAAWMHDGIDYRMNKSIRLLIPVLSGYSGPDIECVLPFVLRGIGHSTELTKTFVDRLIKCRPPPLSFSSFMVLLHR